MYPAKGVRQLGGRGGPLRGGSSSPAAPVLSDCEAVGSPNHRLQNQSPTTHRVQKLWSWCTAVLYACAQPVPCCTSSAARVQSTHGDAMLCTRNLDALHRLLGSLTFGLTLRQRASLRDALRSQLVLQFVALSWRLGHGPAPAHGLCIKSYCKRNRLPVR